MVLIRLAKEEDATAILAIYSPYILYSTITFEAEVPTNTAFAERINTYLQTRPWLVCEINGRIAGYAYAATYRERFAYQWCTETSIYIHDDFHSMGVGRALYTALLEILKKQGYRNVYAVIGLPNEKSVAFHEKMGFTWFATYKSVGYKLNKWNDVGWWQLTVNNFNKEPSAPLKFSEMGHDFLPAAFESALKYIKK